MARGPAPAPTPPPRVAAAPAAASAKPVGRLRRLGRYLFPRETSEPRTESGLAEDRPWGWLYALISLAIAAGLGALWWQSTLSAPVPPGDDPSTWLTTSYPYIGLAFPSGVQLLGYPPAAFPFVGLSVIAGGGPLTGGRIFTEGIFLALGLSTYLLGRGLLRRPSLALMAEGLILAEPDFQQIFYFGGYPNLFAMVFLTLSLAFFVMFLRSRRPMYLIGFWSATTVCVLSHSLTAAVLVGTLGLLAVGLMLVGRLPRTLVLSRAGLVGVGITVVGVGGYYGATHFLQIGHPVYLASTTNVTGVPSILIPFHFPTVIHLFNPGTVAFSTTQTLQILLVMAGLILLAVYVLRMLEPGWLTTPWLVVAAAALAVLVEVLVGAYKNIASDYRRFPYFLYLPFVLGLLLGIEAAVDRFWSVGSPRAAVAVAKPRRWTLAAPRRRWGEPVLVAVALLVVVASADLYTVPASSSYMAYYTAYAHDPAFVQAIQSLVNSGIAGNIVSTSPYSGHWPSTLSNRLTYLPPPSGSVSAEFSPPTILAAEQTEISLANRYFATNSLVGVGVPGLSAFAFNGTPMYGAFANASYQELLRVPPGSLEFGFTNNTTVIPYNVGIPAPPIVAIAGGMGYQISYTGYNATLVETVLTVPGVPTAVVNLTVSDPGGGLTFLQGRIGVVTGVGARLAAGPTSGSFVWNVSTKTGAFTTFGNATPTGSLSKVIPFNSTTGVNPAVVFRENSTNTSTGATQLSLSFTLSTPVAFNVLTSVGPWISAVSTWTNWSIRFILQYNGSTSLALVTPSYLAAEYGAALYTRGGSWAIYVLPQWPLVGPPT